MSRPRLRVGIVGTGLAATPHLKGYAGRTEVVVAAVCDCDEGRARAFAERHSIPQVFTELADMLPAVDLVDIATPTYLHAAMVRQAARAGKHIHCEKPFCRSVAEGEEAWAAVQQAGVKLLVGETYVFLRSHMEARALIEAGEIGRPLQIRQRHGEWRERPVPRIPTGPADRSWRLDGALSGGGAYPWIFDHAVHFFATAEYFVPGASIAEVYAVRAAAAAGTRRAGAAHDPYAAPAVDIPIITWQYDDEACQGVWMRAERLNGKFDYQRGFGTQIIGERGMIEVLGEGGHNLIWDGQQQHLVLHREGRNPVACRFPEGGDDVWDSEICYYSQGHINQVRHLLDCIAADALPRYSGPEGIHAVRCTLAAILSASERRPVRVAEVAADFTAY